MQPLVLFPFLKKINSINLYRFFIQNENNNTRMRKKKIRNKFIMKNNLEYKFTMNFQNSTS